MSNFDPADKPSHWRKPLRKAVLEWLFAGGALVAFAGGITHYLESLQGLDASASLEACKQAHETLRDDQLNGALSPAAKHVYLTEQLIVAHECASRVTQ